MNDHPTVREMIAGTIRRSIVGTLPRITLDSLVAAACIVVAASRFPLWLHLLDGSPIEGTARTVLLNWTAWLIAGGLALIQLLLIAYISRNGWDDDFLISTGWIAIAFGFPMFVSLESVMHAKELTNLNAAGLSWISSNFLHLFMAYCSNVSPELGASLVIRKYVLEERKRELASIESAQLEKAEKALNGDDVNTEGPTVEYGISEEDVKNRAPCKGCKTFIPAAERNYRQSMMRHHGWCEPYKALRNPPNTDKEESAQLTLGECDNTKGTDDEEIA